MLKVLNLGAGVQSSCILMMSIVGELPKPDVAIFADTGWEPQEVYEWLGWLRFMARPSGIEIHTVSNGNIRSDTLAAYAAGKRSDTPPVFVPDKAGKSGPALRKCTRAYKMVPIERKIREILGLTPGQRWPKTVAVEQWLGISVDELERMKVATSKDAWRRWWHPLIEHEWDGNECRMRQPAMTREDCMDWMLLHDFPIPTRSACIGCPYHNDAEWRHIKTRPAEWADAVEYDRLLRSSGRLPGMDGDAYLHRSMLPLDQVPLDGIAGQNFIECGGYCYT